MRWTGLVTRNHRRALSMTVQRKLISTTFPNVSLAAVSIISWVSGISIVVCRVSKNSSIQQVTTKVISRKNEQYCHRAAIQRVAHPLGGGEHPRRLPGQVAQVHHVGVALLPGVAAVVLALGGGPAQLGEEARILRRCREGFLPEGLIGVQQGSELGQVGDGEGGLLRGAHGPAALIVGVADGDAQSRPVHGRILGQLAQPAGVEPAVARLRLLGGHQVVGEILEYRRRLRRGRAVPAGAVLLHPVPRKIGLAPSAAGPGGRLP